MANILILSEAHNGSAKPVTFEILGKLQAHSIDIALIEADLNEASVKSLATFGAKNIHNIKSNDLKNYSPEGYSTALKKVITAGNYDYVFSGATAMGKDLLPRLATSFNAGCASDVTNFTFEGDKFFGTRPFFAGKCLAKVEFTGPKPYFVSIRPNALGAPKTEKPSTGTVQNSQAEALQIRATIKEIIKAASSKVDLTEANIIVSGGRAMKNSENFKILNELADVIGATVGASRAAVDSGYAPHAMQVGQTGKTVSPSLYIACGISGAIQHLAGMRTSKVIVAINSDPEAPIFTRADYGIVGDLFKIVPILTAEFKKLLGK